VERVISGVTPRTRLIVVSHVTSPTAVILPVAEICRRAKELGVPVCIDGPHAPAAVPIDLREIKCDFYTASCHKWLSAPFGSGFLYVHPRHQPRISPHMVSWGRSLSGRPAIWQDELNWLGTRDPAPLLAIPAAIEFLEYVGLVTFRRRSHDLVCYAREKIIGITKLAPLVPDSTEWFGPMLALPRPESVPECAPGTM